MTFVPLRVVLATWPPVNCPRATSYVLVITRVLRTASDGTLPEPNDKPSSVIWFWSARCPAITNEFAVESDPPSRITPGASEATSAGSEASTGRR